MGRARLSKDSLLSHNRTSRRLVRPALRAGTAHRAQTTTHSPGRPHHGPIKLFDDAVPAHQQGCLIAPAPSAPPALGKRALSRSRDCGTWPSSDSDSPRETLVSVVAATTSTACSRYSSPRFGRRSRWSAGRRPRLRPTRRAAASCRSRPSTATRATATAGAQNARLRVRPAARELRRYGHAVRRSSDRLYVSPAGPREREAERLIAENPGITVAELREASAWAARGSASIPLQ